MNPTSRTFVLALVTALGAFGCNDEPRPPVTPAAPIAPPTASAIADAPPVAATPVPAPEPAPPPPPRPKAWTYDCDEGPTHWGDLDPGFTLCKTGVKQTPVDLPAKPAPAKGITVTAPTYAPVPLQLVNNGHTVNAIDGAASSFVFGGTKYTLSQFHLHAPSEHTVAGESFPAELHLVHKSADGKTLVVGIFLRKGKENAVLAPFFANLPTEATTEPRVVPGVTIDIGSFIPKKPRYAHYDGSLTIPPCSEDVSWFVVLPEGKGADAKIPEISEAQIAKLVTVTHGPSNRPLQPLNGRAVTQVSP